MPNSTGADALMGIWQKRLGKRAKMVKCRNPSQVASRLSTIYIYALGPPCMFIFHTPEFGLIDGDEGDIVCPDEEVHLGLNHGNAAGTGTAAAARGRCHVGMAG